MQNYLHRGGTMAIWTSSWNSGWKRSGAVRHSLQHCPVHCLGHPSTPDYHLLSTKRSFSTAEVVVTSRYSTTNILHTCYSIASDICWFVNNRTEWKGKPMILCTSFCYFRLQRMRNLWVSLRLFTFMQGEKCFHREVIIRPKEPSDGHLTCRETGEEWGERSRGRSGNRALTQRTWPPPLHVTLFPPPYYDSCHVAISPTHLPQPRILQYPSFHAIELYIQIQMVLTLISPITTKTYGNTSERIRGNLPFDPAYV